MSSPHAVRHMTWRRVLARRLARHFLSKVASRTRVAEVVGQVCGIHAQVMPSAALSLGLRVSDFTARDLHEALWERRLLVKTYGIRGTVHIFPATELALWTAALAAIAREDQRRLDYLGMTSAQMRGIVEAIGDALDGRRLTRDELGDEVARRLGRWVTERKVSAFGGKWSVWQAAIGTAANAGLLCFGPSEGARVTFVRPEEWLGPQTKVDREAALREVVRRYLAAYGPATTAEIAQWLNAAPRLLGETLRSLEGGMEEIEVTGVRAWQLAGDPAPRAPRGSVHLLPRFDCYVVGSHPRDVLIPPPIVARAAATGLFTRGRSVRPNIVGPTPVLVIDGSIAGIWQAQRAGSRYDIRVQAFVRLTPAQREAVGEAALRIGAIVGQEAALSFGAITTRPHL